MLDYLEALELPAVIVVGIILIYFVMQLIGDFLTFKGKVVPEFMRVKHWLKERNEAKDALSCMPEIVDEVRSLLNDVNKHYSDDNIAQRNAWMDLVNERGVTNRRLIDEINTKIDSQGEQILSMTIDRKRDKIIDFASSVANANDNTLFSREQFNRIFRVYEEYERIIKEHNRTNGEVDIAYRIITEEYENKMRNHTFLEDIRGY